MLSGEPIVNLPKHTTIGWKGKKAKSITFATWLRKFSYSGRPIAKFNQQEAMCPSPNWWVVCPKEYS